MRNIVKLLILAFIFSLFATACGSVEQEVFDVEFVKTSEGTDLEGTVIKYMRATTGQASYSNFDQVLGYEMDTILGDLAMQRIKDVEQSLNCKFDITYFSGDTPYGSFRMSNSVGEYFCDIFCGISDRFREDMKAGALMGLSELDEYIDYRNEEKWGSRSILEVLYWKDDVYGLIPMSWPTSSVSYTGLTVVNEDLIASINATDPRDLYENGLWTWETFRDCLEQYYIQEGSEVKQYAITAQYLGNFGENYILSNGYRLAEKGPDGQYRSGLHDPRALTAMIEAQDVLYGPLSHTIKYNVDPAEHLINGTSVLGILHYAEYLTDRVVKEMPNFGLIAWPSGPNVDPGFIATNHHNLERAIVLSRYSHNIEATAIAINALYEPFEEYPNSESIKDFLYKTFFFDRRDADLYYDLFLASQYSYFGSAPWNSLSSWIENGQTPTEYIESNIDSIEEYIKEEIAPTKQGIEAVWGDAE